MTSNELFKMATKKTTTNDNGVKMVNGYCLADPIEVMMSNMKGGVIHMNTPYKFHFDLPVNSLMGGLNTTTAKTFKRFGDYFKAAICKKTWDEVVVKYFAHLVDENYVRFELVTSHEIITDAMEAIIPLLELEYKLVKLEHEKGSKPSSFELRKMHNEATDMVNINLKKIGINL